MVRRRNNFEGKCFRCSMFGHKATECFVKVSKPKWPSTSRTAEHSKQMRILECNKNEMYKNIDIDGHQVLAFVDLGSECCTIRLEECENRGWEYETYNTVLRGFAGGRCLSVGRMEKLVKIGEIIRPRELLVP